MMEFQAANGMRYNILLLFSLLLLSLNVAGTASADIQVSISPSTQHVDEGQNFSVNVYVEPDVPISSGQINLIFDSSLVSVTNVSEGNLLNQDGASTYFLSGIINNSQGTVTDIYGINRDNVSSTPGFFLNISLVALNKSGTCTFELSYVVFCNSTAYSFPIIVNNGSILIGDVNTPSSSGSRSSSGGGSGGGGASGEVFENIECIEIDREYVFRGSGISYNYKLESNNVGYINFTALSSSGNIAARVEILKNTSSLVNKTPPGIVFKNLNIWVGNYGWATEKNMQDVVIGFKVDRSWVSQNNIDESSIIVYRFNEGEWVPLNTTKKNEDANHLFLEAQTPGFSPFAISASIYPEISAADQITETETGNAYQTSVLEDTKESAKWNALIPVILVAFFALLYGIILILNQKISTIVLFCRDDLLMHRIMLLVIFVPLVGFIDLVGSPLNWVIGILLELVIIMYLVLKVKNYSSTSRLT